MSPILVKNCVKMARKVHQDGTDDRVTTPFSKSKKGPLSQVRHLTKKLNPPNLG